MLRTEPKPCCLLCGKEGQIVHSEVPDFLHHVPGKWNVRRCPNPNCSMIWMDPAPIEADLGNAYVTYWKERTAASPGASSASLQSLYKIGTAIPDALFGIRKELSRLSSMYLDGKKPGRLLDVGCGPGIFLNQMRQRGWQTQGVDFDGTAVEIARTNYNLDVRQGSLFQQRFANDTFDAVTMSHVIEHVPDPIDLLREGARVLKPGGSFVVTSPNAGSIGYKVFQQYWYGLDVPRHLHLFTVDSFAECARRAGCTNARVFSTAARAEAFIAGSFKVRADANRPGDTQPGDGSLVRRTVKTLGLRYRESIAMRSQPGLGEELVLIFEKQDKRIT